MVCSSDVNQLRWANVGGLMYGGLMSGGRFSGGRLSGGPKSYDRIISLLQSTDLTDHFQTLLLICVVGEHRH